MNIKKGFSLISLLSLTIGSLLSQALAPVFHLDASIGITKANGMVSEWIDTFRNIKAIQNTIANQAQFVNQGFGNKPAIRFNGATAFMNMPSVFPVNKDYTIIVVCKANGPSNNILGGNSHTLWMSGVTSPKILHNGDFNNQVSSSFDPGLEPALIIAQYNNSTQKGRLIINGIFEDSSFCPRNVDSTIFISAYQGGYYFNGDIAEIQLFDSYLNDFERKKLETGLKTKYQIKNPPVPDSTFASIPANYQLFPRDSYNEANFQINGSINIAGFDSIQLFLYREQTLISRTSNSLQYALNQKAPFTFSTKIKAELSNYSIEVRIKNIKKDSLLAKRDHLVSGDVFIITGQSNSIFGGNPYNNEFCRTFGKNYSQSKADTLWTISSAVGSGGGPDICAWGMELARLIINKYQIPVCILNGGVGGTTIQQHQRDDINPSLPVNIYGSLLYRAIKSNLTKAVKGIFWYQGESNNSILYFENFKALYEDWKMDYPGVKNIFVVQIHQGCGAGDHAAIREIQRKLPEQYLDIEVISAMGLPGHDGCHYTLDGYLTLAKNIFPLVQNKFYQGIDQPDLHAPNIKKAYFSKPDYSEITLLFGPINSSLILPKDSIINGYTISLKDYFALDNQWKVIQNIRVNKDSVFLELKHPQLANTIQYLPEVNYLDFNSTYEGPYLVNQNQIGALCFYNVPIERQVPTSLNSELSITSNQLMIFPNPVKREEPVYFVTNFNKQVQNAEISLMSMVGEKMFTKKIQFLPAGKNTIEIHLQQVVPQTMIWQFKAGNFYKSGKWIIQ